METLSIESKQPFSLESIRNILSDCWDVESSAADILIVHGTGSRAYLHVDTESGQSHVHRLLVDHSDVDLAKSLILKIADSSSVTVDNDFGTILPGNEFVARIKADTAWDWRYS